MNFGFDIDDTLTNNFGYAENFCKNYFEENNLNFELLDPNTNSLTKMFNWNKEDFDEFWEEKGSEYLENAPIQIDAKKVIDLLKSKGHKVFIITQRFWGNPYERTKDYLDKNGISFDKLVVDAKDKVEACKNLNIDYFIDDRIKTCDTLNENGIKAFVLTTYFNKNEITVSPRVSSLMDFLKKTKIVKNENCNIF